MPCRVRFVRGGVRHTEYHATLPKVEKQKKTRETYNSRWWWWWWFPVLAGAADAGGEREERETQEAVRDTGRLDGLEEVRGASEVTTESVLTD